MKLTKKQKRILALYSWFIGWPYMNEEHPRHRRIVKKLRKKGLLPPEKPWWLKHADVGQLLM